MELKFWGVRGSIPVPGKETLCFGGNTSCVEVRTNKDTLIILDCGTGFRLLGADLMKRGDPSQLKGYIFITHAHWDHIQGIPFFAPFFTPGTHWNIYGPKGVSNTIKEALSGKIQSSFFPIKLRDFGATVEFHELTEGAHDFEDFTIITKYLNNHSLTLGYRIEADNASLTYAANHEPYMDLGESFVTAENFHPSNILPQEEKHLEFLRNSDLVIHDSPYTNEEYIKRKQWGHGTFDYVLYACCRAQVKRVAFYHHDPTRSEGELKKIIESTEKKIREEKLNIEVFAAQEGTTIKLDSQKQKK